MHQDSRQVQRLTMGLILFQILSFAALASMNYHNVYLKEIGFTSQQIGFWGSMNGIVQMITLPLWGIVADKTRSGKITFIISMLLYGVLYLLIPQAGKVYATAPFLMYILLFLYGTIKQSTRSLQDAWFISASAPFGINYASLRMWGAIGFAVVSIIMGIIVDFTGVPFILYLGTIFCVVFAVLCWRFKEPEPDESRKPRIVRGEKMRPWVLFKNYYYVSALIMVFTLATYHGLTVSFYPYILEHAGVDPGRFGVISGYGAFVQAILMFLMTRYGQNVKPYKWLIFAGMVAACENVMYAAADGMWMMLIAGTLWGIEMGINVTVLPKYVSSIVPPQYATTAQTFNGTVMMILCVVGNVVAGHFIAAVGISTYNVCIAVFQLVLTMIFALSIPFGAKVLKKSPPWVEEKNA